MYHFVRLTPRPSPRRRQPPAAALGVRLKPPAPNPLPPRLKGGRYV